MISSSQRTAIIKKEGYVCVYNDSRKVFQQRRDGVGFTIHRTCSKKTDDKIVVFGERNDRYDIPKSEIQITSRNVLIGFKLDEIAKKYKVNHDAPLPTSSPLEQWTQGENLGWPLMKEDIQTGCLTRELEF